MSKSKPTPCYTLKGKVNVEDTSSPLVLRKLFSLGADKAMEFLVHNKIEIKLSPKQKAKLDEMLDSINKERFSPLSFSQHHFSMSESYEDGERKRLFQSCLSARESRDK